MQRNKRITMTKKRLTNIIAKALNFARHNVLALIVAGFVLWHLFMPNTGYIDICRNDAKIRNLEKEIGEEKAEISRLQEEIDNAEVDRNTIERVAREKFGMQRAHEDVYLVVEQPSANKTNNTIKPQSINNVKDKDVPQN